MIDLEMDSQPDDESCGPTCLHSIYRYYGLDVALEDIISTLERSNSGGTLTPLLGKHALLKGFDAVIYVNNLNIFDPTWFKKSHASSEILMAKLRNQGKFKQSKDFAQASTAYQDFLELGGSIRFKTLDTTTLKEYFDKKIPVITGLSSTYLYRTARECFTSEGESYFDDIVGEPCGHFVVLCGYNDKKKLIVVADPYRKNPFTHTNYYTVSSKRIINAILLGVFTYDANLLIIKPKEEEQKKAG